MGLPTFMIITDLVGNLNKPDWSPDKNVHVVYMGLGTKVSNSSLELLE